MHDASAKIPSGILNGNMNQYGDFDQCLNVIAPNDEFSGKYCLASVQLNVSDQLPRLKRIRKLVQSHDAFVNDINDVSIRTFVSFMSNENENVLCSFVRVFIYCSLGSIINILLLLFSSHRISKT